MYSYPSSYPLCTLDSRIYSLKKIILTTDASYAESFPESFLIHLIEIGAIASACTRDFPSSKVTIVVPRSDILWALETALFSNLTLIVLNGPEQKEQVWHTKKMTSLEKELLRLSFSSSYSVDEAIRLISKNIPFRLSIKDAAETIRQNCIDPRQIEELEEKISKFMENRRSEFLQNVEIEESTKIENIFSISEDLLNRDEFGAVIVKTPTGSRKTSELVFPLAEKAIDNGGFPVILAARKSIIAGVDIEGVGSYCDASIENVETCRGLAICINSIINQKWSSLPRKCDTLLIEEANQLLQHLALGKVSRRNSVYEKLISLINNARNVVLTDADASPRLQELLAKTNKANSVRVFEQPADHSGIRVVLGDKELVLAKIFEVLGSGQRTLIAADSKTEVDNLVAAIRNSFPQKSILCITGTSVSEAEQQEFLRAPNDCTHDVVVYSPAITGSVSISKKIFDAHFGLFGSGAITPLEAIQMMRRDRTARYFEIGLSETKSLANMHSKAQTCLSGFHGKSFPSEFDIFRAYIASDIAEMRADFIRNFVFALEYQKFSITIERSRNGDFSDFVKAAKKKNKKHGDEVYEKMIMKAALQLGLSGRVFLNHEANYSPEKIIKDCLTMRHIFDCQTFTTEHFRCWEGGKLQHYLNNFLFASMTEADAIRIDTEERRQRVALCDRTFALLKRELFSSLLNEFNISLREGSGLVTADHAHRFLKILYARRSDWLLVSGITPSTSWANSKRPLTSIIDILRNLFGLQFHVKQIRTRNDRVREYTVSSERLRELDVLLNRYKNCQ